MEESRPRMPLWRKFLVAIEVIVSLFVIWVCSTIVSSCLIWLTIYLCHGECTIDHLELYSDYVKLAYGAFLAVSLAVYFRYINNKYKIL